jgi:sugar phosphate isomerase/epimerase
MIFAGHTMGTPYLNLRGAMNLFKKIGFDGIEIRCAKDGQLDTTTADKEFLDLVLGWKRETGLEIVCITSYFRDFYTEKSAEEMKNLKHVVEIASYLGCRLVRLYGGIDPLPGGLSKAEGWGKTVDGIGEVADFAAPLGVDLCIETHGGSLTLTAKDSVKMVRDVNRKNVGLLLDYAWIAWAAREGVKETIEMCAPMIFHCHYKDWIIDGPMGKRTSCLMGEGTVPWPEIFAALRLAGYDGSLCDEYEKYWHMEDLPEPERGMKKNLDYVKKLVAGAV